MQSSNTVWAVPGNPGNVDIVEGQLKGVSQGSRLILPTIGSAAQFLRN